MNTNTKRPALPTPVKEADLKQPKWDAEGNAAMARDENGRVEFEMWYTERFGWCIPTLGIARAGARAHARGIHTDRTYGVAVNDGQVVRMGMGPHVTARVTVFVTVGRLAALQPLLDLRNTGLAKAGSIRDRISTRRAQGAMRRNNLGWF